MAINKYLDKAGLEHLGEVLVPEIKSRLKQYATMPVPSADYLGKIVQYVGVTTTNYTHGFSYECVADGANYKWAESATEYPQYMADERDAVLTRLKNFYGIRNPIVIGFSTDHHNPGTIGDIERLQAVKTLRDLTKMFHFNVCVLGGDGGCIYNDSDTDYPGLQSRVVALTQALNGSFCPIFHLVGNHDGHQDFQDSLADDVFASHRTDSFKEKYVTVQDRSTNCYYDDPSCNVRFIFLISQELTNYEKAITKQFLQNSLETIPQGYDVIIFSHHPLGSLEDTPGRVDSWNEPLGWSDVVDPYADRIIACIDGHVHCDKHEILHNILYLSTTCAGTRELNDGSTRTQGTADFTAYDVMIIDRDTRTIHCVRYGNGNDRDIVYKAAPYTNVIPTSINTSGGIYNDIGYKPGFRLNSRGAERGGANCGVTGFMPVTKGDVIRLKECNLHNPSTNGLDYIAFYDSSFTCIGSHYPNQYPTSGEMDLHQIIDEGHLVTQFTVPSTSTFDGVAYLRISSVDIGEYSIITINEEIPVTLDPIPDDGTDIDFTNWEV